MAKGEKARKSETAEVAKELAVEVVWQFVIPELKDWLKNRRKERSEKKQKEALLAALDQALQGSLGLVLFLDRTTATQLWYSAEGLLPFAPLIGAGLVEVVDSRPKPEESVETEKTKSGGLFSRASQHSPDATVDVLPYCSHRITLSEVGRELVNAWRNRDAETCVTLLEGRQLPPGQKTEE